VKTEQLRQTLQQDLAAARMQTDRLFQMLAPEAIHMRPIPERHRIIFYIGHLEAFDWNMVAAWAFGKPSFNSEFDRLFDFGIDPVDGKLPDDQPSDWPDTKEILSYSDRIRTTVDDLLNAAEFADPSHAQIFRVAIEHRLMHAETLAYMFHWLDFDLKQKHPSSERRGGVKRRGGRSQAISGGDVTLGMVPNGTFGWDNEFRAHSVYVPEFSMDIFNVTNSEYLEFILAGGYEERSLWSPDAWNWLQQSGTRHPKFWVQRNDSWFCRTMFEEIPLPDDWPVYVSHAEAAAYASWKGKSLPTEAQYHRALEGAPPAGNYDFQSWTPMPVGSFSPTPSGIFDLVGNGWEWTSTAFAPFDGFEPFSFYPGYSADFFDGKHFVLKGASPRTSASLVRASFRNWFQPYYPNVYATFRCVEQ
jgi:ergothioneine biosynthesis protein EgtB